ncbi:MAG: hypothetical protein ACI9MR_004253 [Myxococcota bacterium]|jgi:hypothetical protein
MTDLPPQHEPTNRPRASWRMKLLAMTLSTVLALVAAEFIFGVARSWAFDYLNIYEADATYGVRLAPDASTRTRSWDGTLTDIRTNQLGFRGADWPAPSPLNAGGILLVGDSQAFGYGVPEADALSARLAAHLKTADNAPTVLNAATPTWGPHEYALAAAELAPVYAPSWVVIVANVANDWDEAPQPNNRRVTARDGWAAAYEAGAEPPTAFPARRWLLGESHLVYAVRSLLRDEYSGGMPAVSVDRLMQQLPQLRRPDGPHGSKLTRHLVATQKTCAALANPCRVAVAILPMDVQVDATAFEKYDKPRRPLGQLDVLSQALIDDARRVGVVPIDLAPALSAASPGAFLTDDYHLSPTGHDVVATTIAQAILRRAHP